jgi:AraC-like DNA-binding protein
MLVARGERSVGAGALRWAILLGPQFRMSIVQRCGLVFDTRFVPASSQAANTNPCVYLLLDGTWQTSMGASFAAPQALLVSEAHLDGAEGVRPFTYRAAGEPFCMMELHFNPSVTSLRAASEPVPLSLDAATWAAAAVVAERSRGDDVRLLPETASLLAALAKLGLVSPALAETALHPMPAQFRLLWKAIGPIVERLDLRPTVKELSAVTGGTPREVDRNVRAFVSSFGFVGASWRAGTRYWRLKLAIVFLSADGASIADVARAVGYGSTDAMARAFRDAGLLAPKVVKEQIASAAVDLRE